MGHGADLHKSEILNALLAEAKDAATDPGSSGRASWLDRMPWSYFSALAGCCILATLYAITFLV
ncbi:MULTISPECIES: hypothetical protein [Ochrobactrum]|uniref:Uncharacterized protein n=1 Tax=Ochrobactrum quorumnocens TaxID=271865 RepID=A0A5N1JW02_9HYPH|nr:MULTISPECIES: hypothetical protein [Brucella/Ochrobactrum group]KAA9368317.1 hypothetical protein F3W84_10530 [[Ochrobactrum] quorumnocens]MBD7991780.1 hypothetical protein [Ochrobactrum gallinarum]MDH7792521.1 hypothetical protein [Ochrobactrum sp. AN78]